MRDKISNIYRKIRKSSHLLFWLVLGTITFLVVIIGLFFLTGRTIDEKIRNSINTVSGVNNSLNKLSRQDSTTYTLDYTTTTIESSLALINDSKVKNPNLLENIYHNGRDLELNKLNNDIQKTNDSTVDSLLYIKKNLDMLSKYLNYSATEDFIYLGKDPDDDETRINLAKQAIGELVVSGNLPQEINNELNSSLAAFKTFSSDKNLTELNSTITSNQKEIVIIFDASLSKIVKDYNTFYNSILYQ